MKEHLLMFLDWLPNNLDDIFEIMDSPEEVVERYLKSQED